MDCTSCGLTIDPDDPWFAVYAWDAFVGNPLEAMALHEACYTAGEYIEVWEWQNDENNQAVLVNTGQQQRLVRVPSEGMWWRIDDEQGGWMMVPVPPSARMRVHG